MRNEIGLRSTDPGEQATGGHECKDTGNRFAQRDPHSAVAKNTGRTDRGREATGDPLVHSRDQHGMTTRRIHGDREKRDQISTLKAKRRLWGVAGQGAAAAGILKLRTRGAWEARCGGEAAAEASWPCFWAPRALGTDGDAASQATKESASERDLSGWCRDISFTKQPYYTSVLFILPLKNKVGPREASQAGAGCSGTEQKRLLFLQTERFPPHTPLPEFQLQMTHC